MLSTWAAAKMRKHLQNDWPLASSRAQCASGCPRNTEATGATEAWKTEAWNAGAETPKTEHWRHWKDESSCFEERQWMQSRRTGCALSCWCCMHAHIGMAPLTKLLKTHISRKHLSLAWLTTDLENKYINCVLSGCRPPRSPQKNENPAYRCLMLLIFALKFIPYYIICCYIIVYSSIS